VSLQYDSRTADTFGG